MREECKNYQSRTYASGEVARFCVRDLAPEAPWRCPADCRGYERRLADVAWSRGSLVSPPTPDEPPLGTGSAALLDEAEDIINAQVAVAMTEVQLLRAPQPWWRRLVSRRRTR